MGKIQCNSTNQNLEIFSIIDRKLLNKDTPLDKKLHSEYLRILKLSRDHTQIKNKVYY